MKVVIIGGTGLIGRKLATKLQSGGQDVVAASPSTGVNSLTGEGLKKVLTGRRHELPGVEGKKMPLIMPRTPKARDTKINNA
jgi:nucleoside-diphosphate-sugar epimerase